MIEKFEVVLLLLGIFVLVFVFANKRLFHYLPSSNILIAGFLMFFISWVLTNLESILLTDMLNLLEHLFQLTGAVFIFAWCWNVFSKEGAYVESHSSD